MVSLSVCREMSVVVWSVEDHRKKKCHVLQVSLLCVFISFLFVEGETKRP